MEMNPSRIVAMSNRHIEVARRRVSSIAGTYGNSERYSAARATVGFRFTEVTDLGWAERGRKVPTAVRSSRTEGSGNSELCFPIGFRGKLHIGGDTQGTDPVDIAHATDADHPGCTDIDPFRHAIERGWVGQKFTWSGFIAEAGGEIDGAAYVVVPVEQQGHAAGDAGSEINGERFESTGEFGNGGDDGAGLDADQ